MADTYPRTLHHPTPGFGVSVSVESAEQEAEWRQQGWRVTAPDNKGTDKETAQKASVEPTKK